MQEPREDLEATKRFSFAVTCISQFIENHSSKPVHLEPKEMSALAGLVEFIEASENADYETDIAYPYLEHSHYSRIETIKDALLNICNATERTGKSDDAWDTFRKIMVRKAPKKWTGSLPEKPEQFDKWCEQLSPGCFQKSEATDH